MDMRVHECLNIMIALASFSIIGRVAGHFLFLEMSSHMITTGINFALLTCLAVVVKFMILRFKGLIRYAHLLISVSCMFVLMEDSIQ